MKIIVLGASSLIGSHIYSALKSEVSRDTLGTQYNSSHMDFIYLSAEKEGDVARFIERESPAVIVNSIGIVGKEACAKQGGLAMRLNGEAVEEMAGACHTNGIKLVHLSSVAVHDGKKKGRYTEQDAPSIIDGNLYNITKAAAECFAQSVSNHLIVRIGDTFGHAYQDPQRMGGSVFK